MRLWNGTYERIILFFFFPNKYREVFWFALTNGKLQMPRYLCIA